mmetsp:Transcript_2673/g.6246  ORF Transcript_2673/g.6246 Transcript_2673/m.6246 type:complete len:101 (-) Transcript_2673:384-686(-)
MQDPGTLLHSACRHYHQQPCAGLSDVGAIGLSGRPRQALTLQSDGVRVASSQLCEGANAGVATSRGAELAPRSTPVATLPGVPGTPQHRLLASQVGLPRT